MQTKKSTLQKPNININDNIFMRRLRSFFKSFKRFRRNAYKFQNGRHASEILLFQPEYLVDMYTSYIFAHVFIAIKRKNIFISIKHIANLQKASQERDQQYYKREFYYSSKNYHSGLIGFSGRKRGTYYVKELVVQKASKYLTKAKIDTFDIIFINPINRRISAMVRSLFKTGKPIRSIVVKRKMPHGYVRLPKIRRV